MQLPTTDSISPGRSRLLVVSFLIVFFALLFMLLRIAQQNYIQAAGVLWVANLLTLVLHAVYWGRYGLAVGYKVAIVTQVVLAIAPLFFGKFGIELIFVMLGGEVRYW